MLAQTWSVLSFSNLVPTSHTLDITLDRARLIYGIIQKMDMNLCYIISTEISLIAQHDSSRLGFLALIIALCKAKGVISDSFTLESLGLAINVAYNLDDLSVTFRGSHKAKGKRSEAPPSSEIPPSLAAAPIPSTPSASTFVLPAPLYAGPSNFSFTPQMLHSMLQSLHRGQSIIMQSLEGLGLPSIMSMDEFDLQIPKPSPAPVPEETQPATPVTEPEQPIQDSSAVPTLDLNEDQPQDEQDETIIYRKRGSKHICPKFGGVIIKFQEKKRLRHEVPKVTVELSSSGG
ncbi:hypothetical protein GmHk_20G057210 [Glycine max]|nr:hypothetical protein GmHk_20G057210 [Glycine max]